MQGFFDLTGARFGKWKVVGKSDRVSGGWICVCECGKIGHPTAKNLFSGRSKSCGHWRAIKMIDHPNYAIWQNMKRRCYWERNKDWQAYGGRGIVICERWKNSFSNFVEDMGMRPSKEYSLDRIDNDGNYEKDNCKWATMKEQGRNRRNSLEFKIGGISCLYHQLPEVLRVSKARIDYLYYRCGIKIIDIYNMSIMGFIPEGDFRGKCWKGTKGLKKTIS